MRILLCYKYTRKDIIHHPVDHCNHSKEIIVNDTRQKTKYYLIIYFIRQHIERISDTASTIALQYSGYKNRVFPIFVNYVVHKKKIFVSNLIQPIYQTNCHYYFYCFSAIHFHNRHKISTFVSYEI